MRQKKFLAHSKTRASVSYPAGEQTSSLLIWLGYVPWLSWQLAPASLQEQPYERVLRVLSLSPTWRVFWRAALQGPASADVHA